jgi:peptidoglycan/LPS O-acetylase OafA/YrhL
MKRSRAIDLLRVLAVLLVMGRHMDRCPENVSPFLHWITDKWEIGGWIGVDLFFVLSGFLVSGLLFGEYEKHGNISMKTFLVRRGFKIYPAFWLLTMVSIVIFIWRGDHFKRLAIPSEFLFVQNYGPSFWNHTWSLAVEEHFYFFLVIFLFALLKFRTGANPFRIVPLMFGALAVTCLALRFLTLKASPQFIDKAQLYPTHLRIDSLFCGVVISYFYHMRPAQFMNWAKTWRWFLFAAGVACLAPAFFFVLKKTPWIFTLGFTLFYVGAACLLMAMLGISIPDHAWSKIGAYVGSHSYSIYLWHMPVLLWIVPLFVGTVKVDRNWFAYFSIYIFGSIAFGILMSTLLEFPMLRLRDRLFPSRSRPLVP